MGRFIASKKQVIHRLSSRTEPWMHVVYCAVLFVEGHGLYATVGGALGVVVLLDLISGEN